MRVRASHDNRGAVLRLEREGAFHPQHQGRAGGRRIRIAFGGPRRPLQLNRSGMTGEGLADNGRPIGNQAGFAQTARGHRLGDEPGGEFSQRLGAAARALHHRFGTDGKKAGHEVDGMSPNVSALASEAKRKAIVARTLAWCGPLPPVARVACGAGGDPGPLPGLALGDPAATDDRPGGGALLSGLHRQMAHGRGPGSCPNRRRHERVRGPRLLFTGAESARLRQGSRPTRRRLSERRDRIAGASGRWRVYRGCDRSDRLRPPDRAGRRQYRAHSGAAPGFGEADRSRPSRTRSGGARAGSKPQGG